MKANNSKERIKKLCDLMGEDFNDPACKEMQEHIDKCPTCKVYYDTIKKTVLLCQENDCLEELPDDVNKRLMKVLDLGEFFKDKNNSTA